jgi:hypothetical protein
VSGLARTALLVLVGVAAGGCIGCARRGEPVATVIDSRGTVERAEGAETFRAAGPGQVFVVGDTLRTRAASQARLRLTNGTVLRVLENARIRFARGAVPAARGADLNIELGAAEVESATEELALVTPLGVARVQRGARVRISSDGERSTLEVVVGRAVVLGSAGELIVDQGQGARIKAGEAGPERYDLLIGRPIVETPAAGAVPAARGADLNIELGARGHHAGGRRQRHGPHHGADGRPSPRVRTPLRRSGAGRNPRRGPAPNSVRQRLPGAEGTSGAAAIHPALRGRCARGKAASGRIAHHQTGWR